MRSCANSYSGEASHRDSTRKSRISSDQTRLCSCAAGIPVTAASRRVETRGPTTDASCNRALSSLARRSIREAITPLYGWGNFQRIPGRFRSKPTRITIGNSPVDELPRNFFDELRDLAGVPEHMGLEGVELRYRPKQAV